MAYILLRWFLSRILDIGSGYCLNFINSSSRDILNFLPSSNLVIFSVRNCSFVLNNHNGLTCHDLSLNAFLISTVFQFGSPKVQADKIEFETLK